MQGSIRVWESNRGMPQLKSPISRLSSARQANGKASSASNGAGPVARPGQPCLHQMHRRSGIGAGVEVMVVDGQPVAGALLALGMEAGQLGSVQLAAGEMARRQFTRRSMAQSASSRQRSFHSWPMISSLTAINATSAAQPASVA